MKSLIFTDNADIHVEYKVDLLNGNDGNITVMEIKGLDTVEEEALFKKFQRIETNLAAFKAFAEDNGLQLTVGDQKGIETLVELEVEEVEEGGEEG